MSKESKFISVLTDMAWGEVSNKKSGIAAMNCNELTELLLWFEQLAIYNGLYYENMAPVKEEGMLKLKIEGERGKGLLCQVKLFPAATNGKTGYHYLANWELQMYREVTNDQGSLQKRLPVGEYDVEITRGSEYAVTHQKININKQETIELQLKLTPVINLKELSWYCGDLHHHSIYSSPVYGGTDPVVESPLEVSNSMRAAGLSFGALSDHHNILNHSEWEQTKTVDFTPLISKEISTSNGHVMSLGVREDVIYQIPEENNRTDVCLREEFIRITDCIKGAGGLSQINHPRDHSRSISWNSAYNDMVTIFDTMEIWNGSNPMYQGTTNDKAFHFWLELLEAGIYLPATTGSDTHNILANDYTQIYGRLRWLEALVREGILKLPEEISKQSESFLSLCSNELLVFEKWAKSNLSSGGVRTYVYLEEEKNTQNILNSLRKGQSFLTNGPVLIPDIEGILPGGTYRTGKKKIDINLKLIANRPLERLYLYRSGKVREVISLKENGDKMGFYDYSFTLQNILLEGVRWILFQAESDCTNMAITNPIFIEKE